MRLSDYNRTAERKGVEPQYLVAVVTVHGMNTRGAWQKKIVPDLEDNGIGHVPVDFGTVRFGSILPGKREDVAQKIVDAVLRNKPRCRTSGIIAHSFATLCLGDALQRNPDLKIERICLFGSIMCRRFPWRSLQKQGQFELVLNETCRRDCWVHLAPLVPGWGAGRSGCYGFLEGGGSVYNCPYEWTSHSRLATQVHCLKTWIPFLLQGSLPASCAASAEVSSL